MKIKYNLTENDYINFNICHMRNSKALRKTIMINRFLVPLIFLLMPFILYNISDIPFSYWAITFILIYILWVSLYEKYVYRINRKRIKRMLEEKSNNGLIGERILEIDEENIKITNNSGESKFSIKTIKDIIEDKEYIFIYINSVAAIIIPLEVFKDKEDKERFKKLLNYGEENE